MCGVIGYVGPRPAAPILLDGLSRLEYRGYDSAGIAVVTSDHAAVSIHKKAGKLSSLIEYLGGGMPEGNLGIGHTRWATHGKPSEENAHPHTDCTGRIIVIHNGIIENYVEFKQRLIARGHCFTSETDTETLAHLIEDEMARGATFPEAFQTVVAQVVGGSAVIATCLDAPGLLLAARLGNAGGIVIGYGDEEMYLASDLSALIPYTRQAAYLGNREMAALRASGVVFSDLGGTPLTKAPQTITMDAVSIGKQGYKHFMLKEIMEQPRAITEALVGRVSLSPADVTLEEITLDNEVIRGLRRVVLLGMGTSYHAAMLGRLYFEQLAGIPADTDNASEFRYRNPLLTADTLVVSITQSGETVDTLAAMERVQAMGIPQIVITNTPGSQATRVADNSVFMRADIEVGVASTKCYTNAVTCLFMLAIHLGKIRGTLGPADIESLANALARLPSAVGAALEQGEACESLAHKYYHAEHFLFLGRGPGYPTAMEGALKLKEISYIHAEGYPAGEMKHGPISLIDDAMPVVVIAPQDGVYEKMLSNVSEVKARDGEVIALISEGDTYLEGVADHVLRLPTTHPLLTPVVSVIPLQLLAYHIAVRLGCDVDQPRNLAKSVTVE